MSAFDMLSREQQDRILAEAGAATERYAELAKAMLAEQGFLDRFAVYLLGAAGNKMPYDPEPLARLRRELRSTCEALAKHGKSGATTSAPSCDSDRVRP